MAGWSTRASDSTIGSGTRSTSSTTLMSSMPVFMQSLGRTRARSGGSESSGHEADLCIDEPGGSRRHALVRPGPDGTYLVEELGSTNGTFVRGRHVTSAALLPGEVGRA